MDVLATLYIKGQSFFPLKSKIESKQLRQCSQIFFMAEVKCCLLLSSSVSKSNYTSCSNQMTNVRDVSHKSVGPWPQQGGRGWKRGRATPVGFSEGPSETFKGRKGPGKCEVFIFLVVRDVSDLSSVWKTEPVFIGQIRIPPFHWALDPPLCEALVFILSHFASLSSDMVRQPPPPSFEMF